MNSQTKTIMNEPSTVQDFYEQYPYPRPVETLDKYRELWKDRERRRADYHLFCPAKAFREDQSILIAGCGTSQAAKHAMRWRLARVVGIDFSATSVDCTATLKQKYGLDNLELYQLPVERASELETAFDQIVCTGVLHHLPDPDAGLRALQTVLKPDGAMHLMVYAPYGRTGIYMLQEFSRRVGIAATDDGIRDLVAALGLLPSGHPLQILLREAPDFQYEAAIADALLHPQDRAYSVPQLFAFLENCGLQFGRWLKQAPYSSHCGTIASLPHASRLAELSAAEQYAAVELFRGTMVTHSAVVYRNDHPNVPQISFAGDGWTGYVPLRMPDTICVEERLPPGAAGVLINRSHTFRDLFIPVNSTEKSWFAAIDGTRSIGEIVKEGFLSSRSKSPPEIARRFFERLWLYDQVVFDTSRATS